VRKRDELALMWAVAKHGPVAVSLDASQPNFKFYSEGVYSAKHCLTKKVCDWREGGRGQLPQGGLGGRRVRLNMQAGLSAVVVGKVLLLVACACMGARHQ
jgi:hypothetical protein